VFRVQNAAQIDCRGAIVEDFVPFPTALSLYPRSSLGGCGCSSRSSCVAFCASRSSAKWLRSSAQSSANRGEGQWLRGEGRLCVLADFLHPQRFLRPLRPVAHICVLFASSFASFLLRLPRLVVATRYQRSGDAPDELGLCGQFSSAGNSRPTRPTCPTCPTRPKLGRTDSFEPPAELLGVRCYSPVQTDAGAMWTEAVGARVRRDRACRRLVIAQAERRRMDGELSKNPRVGTAPEPLLQRKVLGLHAHQ
jgi:hypothetical protein